MSLDGGLVTGITGQDGAYLAELLLGKGYRVVGGFRRASTVNTTRLEALGVAQDVDLVPFDLTDHGNMRLVQHLLDQGYEVVAGVHGREARLPPECECVKLDVTDKEGVRQLIGRTQPGEIYHLAGLTRPASGTVEEFYRVNFGGALNLLEAVRDRTPEAGFLLVSSAYVYGKVAHLISETEPHKPVNHYGVSKAAADLLGYTYAVKEGLNVVRVRPFNHSGPAQSPDFVLPSLVRQFAQVLVGNREPIIRLGNLDSVRDLSDVRDVVRGYRLALRKGRPGEAYNLGSGRGISIRGLFELVSREAGVEAELVTEPSRMRATDIPYLVADTTKAREELGWEAEIPLAQTIRELLKTVQP